MTDSPKVVERTCQRCYILMAESTLNADRAQVWYWHRRGHLLDEPIVAERIEEEPSEAVKQLMKRAADLLRRLDAERKK